MANRTKLNILIVDDDVSAAKALSRLLRACGHAVHITYAALEGFEPAYRTKPHLILHDLAMCPIDGYEAARRLRAVPSLSATILIACSASVDEKQARAAGFDGWLIKPVSDCDLDAVLDGVLQRVNQSPARSQSNSGSNASWDSTDPP